MKNTVSDLLKRAMSIMGEEEKDKNGYMPFVLDIANQLIADCFETNNAVREGKGLEPIAEVPWLTKESDVLPYEPEVAVNVMAYGMAFWLLFQDDENDKANMCNAAYETNKARVGKAMYADVVNAYR